jgi:hypothetical protein
LPTQFSFPAPFFRIVQINYSCLKLLIFMLLNLMINLFTLYHVLLQICNYIYSWYKRGRRGRNRMVVGFATTVPRQSVAIITDVVSSNLDHGEEYNIMWFCQWLAAGRWFSAGPPVSSTNKTDRHDITEILLKVALNTIRPNQTYYVSLRYEFRIKTMISRNM